MLRQKLRSSYGGIFLFKKHSFIICLFNLSLSNFRIGLTDSLSVSIDHLNEYEMMIASHLVVPKDLKVSIHIRKVKFCLNKDDVIVIHNYVHIE